MVCPSLRRRHGNRPLRAPLVELPGTQKKSDGYSTTPLGIEGIETRREKEMVFANSPRIKYKKEATRHRQIVGEIHEGLGLFPDFLTM